MVTTYNPALVEARLRALARTLAEVELTKVDPSVGAGSAGDQGFYFVDDDPRAVGRALHWAQRQGLSRVEILVAAGGSDLARRAELLSQHDPDQPVMVRAWNVDGSDVSAAEASACPQPPTLPADHWALAGVMTEAGARPIDDNGVLVADVVGLEVARVVDGADGPVMEIGVVHADRELNRLVHGGLDTDSGLRRVIAAVAQHRTGETHHPLSRLGRERWLRAMLLDQPAIIGASWLEPLVPLRARVGLVATEPAAACGELVSGQPVVAVTVVGVDLDLVPEAADYRQRWNPEAELILAVPARDLALNTALLGRVPAARAVALDGPWGP